MSGMVLELGFNEGSGAVVADSSGAGNNFAMVGAGWITPAAYGAGLSPADTIYAEGDLATAITDAFTIMADVYRTFTTGTGAIWWGDGLVFFVSGTGQLGVWSSKVSQLLLSAASVVPLNTKTHVAISKVAGNDIWLVVNGVGTGEHGLDGHEGIAAAATVWIGTDTDPETFHGWIDNVRVFNRQLTDEEVATYVNNDVTTGGSSSTPKSGSDSGTLTELATLHVTLSRTDSGTETESSTVNTANSKQGSDSGLLTELAIVTAAIVSADSASFSESSGIVSQTSKSGSDSGELSESLTSLTIDDGAPEGTLIESAELDVAAGSVDSASVLELSLLTNLVGRSDSGAMSEVSSLQAGQGSTDSGALSESVVLVVLLSDSDSGTVTESSDVGGNSDTDVDAVDSATLFESASVTVTLVSSDSAALSEISQTLAMLDSSDQIVLVESAILDTATHMSGEDSATLVETAVVTVFLERGDSAALAEMVAGRSIFGVDVISFLESSTVDTGVPRSTPESRTHRSIRVRTIRYVPIDRRQGWKGR